MARDRDYDAGLSGRKFYRVRERRILGGVCTGIAEYFGFNLFVTRVLAVLGLVMFTPLALLLYFGTVILVPARSIGDDFAPPRDRRFKQALRARPKTTIGDVRRRYQKLDARLARLERHVTSPRYNLDQEIRNL